MESVLEDIKQITSQFRTEVPRQRTAWPNSIRNRVMSLFDLGMSSMAISKKTSIPYHTVLKWKSTRGEFRELSTVTVPTSGESLHHHVGMVTVTTSKGLRVEGLTIDQAIVLIERLG